MNPNVDRNNNEIASALTGPAEDVEGHAGKVLFIDGPQEETEDVEGHAAKVLFIDGPQEETEDVEAHKFVYVDGPEDVEGHVQPRGDLDVER
jgi:hypothetical protein